MWQGQLAALKDHVDKQVSRLTKDTSTLVTIHAQMTNMGKSQRQAVNKMEQLKSEQDGIKTQLASVDAQLGALVNKLNTLLGKAAQKLEKK